MMTPSEQALSVSLPQELGVRDPCQELGCFTSVADVCFLESALVWPLDASLCNSTPVFGVQAFS